MALYTFRLQKKKQDPTRSFYMEVTPWPADFTPAELNNAYDFINTSCAVVSHHFEEGIPYQEAYMNTNWPQVCSQTSIPVFENSRR